MYFCFGEIELVFDYMMVICVYFEQYGKLLVFYSDKYGIFRVNNGGIIIIGIIQFGWVFFELGIELICVNSL